MKIAIIDKTTSAIMHSYECDSIRYDIFRHPYNDESTCVHMIIPDNISADIAGCEKDANGDFKIIVDQTKMNAAMQQAWSKLRKKRNELLLASDYTRLDDCGLLSQQQEAWRVYRQALRDLPNNTEDPRSPTWPSKPL
jgi:hypothetical protein